MPSLAEPSLPPACLWPFSLSASVLTIWKQIVLHGQNEGKRAWLKHSPGWTLFVCLLPPYLCKCACLPQCIMQLGFTYCYRVVLLDSAFFTLAEVIPTRTSKLSSRYWTFWVGQRCLVPSSHWYPLSLSPHPISSPGCCGNPRIANTVSHFQHQVPNMWDE